MQQQRKLLGQILKDKRIIGQGQIQEALSVQRDKGGQIGQILLQMGAIDRQQLLAALAEQAGMEMVDLDQINVPESVLKKVDPQTRMSGPMMASTTSRIFGWVTISWAKRKMTWG